MTLVTVAPSLADLTGGANPLVSVAGPTYGSPLLLAYRGAQYVFVPGWDNKYLQSPSNPDLSVTEVDVRIDSDRTEYLTISPQDYNVLLAQPTTSGNTDGRFAVTQHKVTGICRLYWSTDGATWFSLDSTAAPSFGVGPGRLAFTFEANNGAAGKTFRLYEQPHDAPDDLINASVSSAHWTLVSATTTAGTTSIHPGDSPLSISAFDGAVDALGVQGWMVAHRVQVRDAIDGVKLYDLDPTRIRLPLTWEPVTVAAQDTQQGTFEGGADEDWTITNFVTSSYMVTVVDRDCVVFGNDSYGAAGPDDDVFDFDATEPFTLALCYRWLHVGSAGAQMLAHQEFNAPRTLAGYSVLEAVSIPGGPVAIAADGADQALGVAPADTNGVVSVFAYTLDRTGVEVTGWLDGEPGTPDPLTAVGSLSDPGQPLVIAGQLDGGGVNQAPGSFELFAAALWRRVLTADEIALVAEELAAGGAATEDDDYSPFVA